ncbi:MAG TPA: methyltransferase [bacterium]|nr:methyltransferase [bacterium]
MEYEIQNQKIELKLSDDVFKPSPHGSSILANVIKINKNDTVLDVGTGTGLLAILAAKLGGKVTSIDILPQAVELAKKNIKKNNVSIDIRCGDLFEPVKKEIFDVIIANVPQENLSPKIIASLSQEVVIGMHGGKNGNETLLRTINNAHSFMHTSSRLYVVVYSMSNFRESIKEIIKKYNAKMINFYSGEVKDFLYSDVDWYEEESKKGKLEIYKKGEKYFADLFAFELKIKNE